MLRRNLGLPLLALLAASCIQATVGPDLPGARRPQLHRPPIADSPANALRLLEWAWNLRSPEHDATLFSDDFRFVFQLLDSAGAGFRATPWGRADELIATQHLFVPTPGYPRLLDLELQLDRELLPLPDPRPGKSFPWHTVISTRAAMGAVVVDSGLTRRYLVNSGETFYLVRGDSAIVLADLAHRAALRDSTVWYIERWDETTIPSAASGTRPTTRTTWGAFKVMFR